MKPHPFDYQRAECLDEAASALAQYGSDGRILAGGQSLIAMLNMRLLAPKMIIDISRVRPANYVRRDPVRLSVGCSTTQSTLERFPDLAKLSPLLAKALPHAGHFQTRNKGTLCGSIAHADPSSELPLCISVLNAKVLLKSKSGARVEQGRDFFTGLLQTQRQPDELIAEIRLPLAGSDDGYGFREMAFRHGDFAIIAVAVHTKADGLTIGVGGLSDRPHVREWPLLEGTALSDALNELAWELDCQDDAHASAAYRRHLIRELGREAVEEAQRCRQS